MGRVSHGGKKSPRACTHHLRSLQQLKDKVKFFFRRPILKCTEMFGDLVGYPKNSVHCL
jgi:hypothetical protein